MNSRVKIFKEEPGFIKLFRLFKEKYRSLGRIGGTVGIKDFESHELDSIAGFLGVPKEKILQKGTISLIDFDIELANTGFEDYTLLTLLEEFFQERIWTKQEELEVAQEQEDAFFQSIHHPELGWWIEWIRSKGPDTRWIWSLYKANKDNLREKIQTTCKAFTLLPKEGEFERLPFFSQRITGNPHYFDNNEIGGKLFVHCLYVDQLIHGNTEVVMPKSVEELNELLSEYRIMRDDLWNFVTCQGLLASSNGEVHPVWKAAALTRTVMNIPMKELAKIDKVAPVIGKKIWVVENSSVASTIMDRVPDAAIICTHGQVRLAGWRLLDLLVAENCILYYSGDLDPEGISIANRLKERYKENVHLWRMDKKSYLESLSSEDISTRLSKLDRITSPEWVDVITAMKETKLAGYQEALVHEMIDDIKGLNTTDF
ncbi:TIGR02679 family protein [Bacillus timonensis]|uniref:TIGR02679 family protein n=1 Tax=Bacillus timonensis TaxID=1033734 RepID=A0A4V3V788_9BACI|nr:TIGR02679 family protein [Bacillus timonensis]THE10413.1 TIGR02679 family protein [Bacillus timonensis]